MLIKEINKDELLKYLFRDDIIGCGFFGVVLEYDDDTLIKLYYKSMMKTYKNRDSFLLDGEIEIYKKRLDEMGDYLEYILPIEEKKNNLLFEIGYLKAVLMYNGYKIGVLLNYYKGYQELGKVYDNLSNGSKSIVLRNLKKYLDFLLNMGIYPSDLKEDNILVNPNNLDVKIIDLDDYMTNIKFDGIDYISIRNNINITCNEMVKRLNKNISN